MGYNIYQHQNKTLRDAGIYEKYHISQRGVSFRKLGEQYNLTGARLQQIVKKVEKELGIPPVENSLLTEPLNKLDNEERGIINLLTN